MGATGMQDVPVAGGVAGALDDANVLRDVVLGAFDLRQIELDLVAEARTVADVALLGLERHVLQDAADLVRHQAHVFGRLLAVHLHVDGTQIFQWCTVWSGSLSLHTWSTEMVSLATG